MYDPNKHPLEDGPKKYGAAAGTKEILKPKYAGEKADEDDGIKYDNEQKYNSGSEDDDPFKVGYDSGDGEDDEKKDDKEDELWNVANEEDKTTEGEEGDEEKVFDALKKTFSFSTPEEQKESEEEKKKRKEEEEKKKQTKSVEDVIEMVSEPKKKEVIDLDKKKEEREVIK